MLYPASIKNDTEQIFITCRKLSDIKRVLIDGKMYGLLGITDLKKINNWEEIKGEEINNRIINKSIFAFPSQRKH